MKRLFFTCSLIVIFSFVASTPYTVAQDTVANAPPCTVQVFSKNLKLLQPPKIYCQPCLPSQQKINVDQLAIVVVLSSNPLCDDPQSLVPNGSKLTVTMTRIVRILPVADKCDLAKTYWGSFTNDGTWTLTSPAGSVLFTGDVYRGTIGTCAHRDNQYRCCNPSHEEVYIEGKGVANTPTAGKYLRAMGVITATYDPVHPCKYVILAGKYDGVITQP